VSHITVYLNKNKNPIFIFKVFATYIKSQSKRTLPAGKGLCAKQLLKEKIREKLVVEPQKMILFPPFKGVTKRRKNLNLEVI